MMLTPETGAAGLQRLGEELSRIPRREPVVDSAPEILPGKRVVSIREAILSASEMISVENSVGRVLASPSVGCPPAVSILVSGEQIDAQAVRCFRYYGVESVTVVKE